MDNPLSKIIEKSRNDFDEIFPTLSLKHLGANSPGFEIKPNINWIIKHNDNLIFDLLQGFLTEIGEDEEEEGNGQDPAVAFNMGINQTKTHLRKVVEGAMENLKK